MMAIFAACGLVYSLISQIKGGASTANIIDKSLDMLTVTVPPGIINKILIFVYNLSC